MTACVAESAPRPSTLPSRDQLVRSLPVREYSTTVLVACPVFGFGSPFVPTPFCQPTYTCPSRTVMSSGPVVAGVVDGAEANVVIVKPDGAVGAAIAVAGIAAAAA